MSKRNHKRRVRLVRAGLQLRLIFTFLGVASLALLLQFILFMSALTETAVGLPNDGLILMERINGLLFGVFLTSFCLLLPTLFGIGLIMTHRVAGPIYRFETFFNQILKGQRPADIKLRKADELQEFSRLVNRVTLPLRADREVEAEPIAPEPRGPSPQEKASSTAA